MNYELELEKAIGEIRQERAKLVCIQLPEGLRTRADEITRTIESSTGSNVIIWLGSCFGACDVPFGLDRLGVELLVQWGHSEWQK